MVSNDRSSQRRRPLAAVDCLTSREKRQAIGDQSFGPLSQAGGPKERLVSRLTLHGGMGMTEELAIGHYFKRLTAMQHEFGSTASHLSRYAQLTKP